MAAILSRLQCVKNDSPQAIKTYHVIIMGFPFGWSMSAQLDLFQFPNGKIRPYTKSTFIAMLCHLFVFVFN